MRSNKENKRSAASDFPPFFLSDFCTASNLGALVLTKVAPGLFPNHTDYSHVAIQMLDNIRSENATNRAECGIRIRTKEGQWAPCCVRKRRHAANDCSTKLACFHLQKFNLMSTLYLMQPPVISNNFILIDGQTKTLKPKYHICTANVIR